VAQLTKPARHLLERIAWLASEPVPEFLLDVPVPQVDGGDLREALADLAAYSLATRDLLEPRFSVHRLVQDVTRRSLDGGTSHSRLVEALRWVDAGFVGDPEDVRTWPRLHQLIPHTQAVTLSPDEFELAQGGATTMAKTMRHAVGAALNPHRWPKRGRWGSCQAAAPRGCPPFRGQPSRVRI